MSEQKKVVDLGNLNIFKDKVDERIQDSVGREDLTGRTDWRLDELNLINQAENGVIPISRKYICRNDGYDYEARGTTPEENSYAFVLDVNLILSSNGYYVVQQDWWQHDGYHYIRYYDTNNSEGWADWIMQPMSVPMDKLRSGTSVATTSNCPSGCWYGQY